jgi:molybdopterin-binding protein
MAGSHERLGMMLAAGRVLKSPSLVTIAATKKARTAKMKLSARNILPGKVVAVTKGSTTAHIKVELASGLTITSSITNEAVDELALKVGDSVSAVIKSSDVMIGK